MAELLPPVTPGELLHAEFLAPLGITAYRLAKDIAVPQTRIWAILKGKRAITADTDLRLCRFFGLSEGYWLRAQAAHDLEIQRRAIAEQLEHINPYTAACV
ncbi:MAG: HigA family addiction module antitoxin [Prochlorococcaceae cyanobacterium]